MRPSAQKNITDNAIMKLLDWGYTYPPKLCLKSKDAWMANPTIAMNAGNRRKSLFVTSDNTNENLDVVA
jgi:hypothetical protein